MPFPRFPTFVLLDLCEAVDGPSPEWRKEAEAERAHPNTKRCRRCRYLITRCGCPGGARWKAAA